MTFQTHIKTFIDSNVWLYAIMDVQDPKKSQIAKQVITQATLILVSTQTINEVCVNLVRNKFLDEPGIRAVSDSFYGQYQVVDISRNGIRKASEIRERYSVSYWDSLVLATALIDGCEQLLTEDMQDGFIVDGQLTIINPFK
ncbi:MAG: PIN domain-containing protein [Blastochloris sp.]|nr:PIN domain-containing protein [Blastochloris sp.]